MTNNESTYRIVNINTGMVIAEGPKRAMLKLVDTFSSDCVVYFQGIPLKAGTA